MSPVQRSQGHAGRALAVAAAGVVVALGIAVAVSVMANRGAVKVRLGDDTFQGADAENMADEIAERGPIIFSDVAGGDRDIWLQHLGDDPDSGWYAFDIRPPGGPRDCVTEWDDRKEVFVANCGDDQEFPVDGEGLPQYPVKVEDGKLDVDLNAEDRSTSTTNG
ncbi:MAG TPA: hypothetical protein VGJ86_25395 [Acidimicrobiales bacterium]|jgi:hypothetical protein